MFIAHRSFNSSLAHVPLLGHLVSTNGVSVIIIVFCFSFQNPILMSSMPTKAMPVSTRVMGSGVGSLLITVNTNLYGRMTVAWAGGL
jgi:hypothetical protein